MTKKSTTQQGITILKHTLNKFKNLDRKKIIKKIKEARSHGDLKENAEYSSAKEKQNLIEKKIVELEKKILDIGPDDIKKAKKEGKIIFGSTIELTNIKNNQKKIYKIVGEEEINILQNKISINSLLAKNLLFKKINNIISIKTSEITSKYKITKILYI